MCTVIRLKQMSPFQSENLVKYTNPVIRELHFVYRVIKPNKNRSAYYKWRFDLKRFVTIISITHYKSLCLLETPRRYESCITHVLYRHILHRYSTCTLTKVHHLPNAKHILGWDFNQIVQHVAIKNGQKRKTKTTKHTHTQHRTKNTQQHKNARTLTKCFLFCIMILGRLRNMFQ